MAKIRVCATTANLGPGFDCLGAALSIYNETIIEQIPSGIEIFSKKIQEDPKDNLIYKSVIHCLKYFKKDITGIRIIENNEVPVSRGLGSSAACIVAGIVGAMLMTETKVDKEILMKLATEMEGHPDNVAPAIFGGIIASVDMGDKIICQKILSGEELNFFALVPDFKLQTKLSREALPSQVPFRDGVFNAGRAALLVSTLINKDYKNLKYCFEDKLHQNYRSRLIPNYDDIFAAAYKSGADGVYLSGAGPTIMAVSQKDIRIKLKEEIGNIQGGWKIVPLCLDMEGVTYEHDCS